MKRLGLVFTTSILFALSLYLAYEQGTSYAEVQGIVSGHLAAPLESSLIGLVGLKASFVSAFGSILSALMTAFGGSLVAAVIVLALAVELITLYPAVNIQLKQKKIHLFHKKLVDRFARGELTMSETRRELDVLYSVNEKMHKRGALLVSFQIIAFVLVLFGLYYAALVPSVITGGFSSFNFALLAKPISYTLPILVGLAYLLHSLVKIHLKQREDYISSEQIQTALIFAVFGSIAVFIFAGTFATLLSIYVLTQITFATMRYIIVEDNSKVWGKLAQRQLIKLLHAAESHNGKVQELSRKFNHLPIIRNMNFHLLEEAMSMSLSLLLIINATALI